MKHRAIRRTLESALVAACLFGANLVLLTLFLNPGTSLVREMRSLLLALFLPYTAGAWVALSLSALVGSLLRWWPAFARAPIERFPWLTSLSLLSVSAAAALYWLNLMSYRYSIPEESVRALAGAALALTAAALLLVSIGLDVLLFPLRSGGVPAALVVIAAGASVVVPLALLPLPQPASHPVPLATEPARAVRRVTLVGIDGLGPEQVTDGVASGGLPALARMMREGAHGPLATIQPTHAPALWTTVFTGRFPRDHGVKSFVRYRLLSSRRSYELLPKGALVGLLERAGLVSSSPVTAAARKCPALWNALNAFGVQAGLVRFWGTFPPERGQGFMLSNYFHLLVSDPSRRAETLHPPDLIAEIQARVVAPQDVDRRLVSEFVDLSVDIPEDAVPWQRDLIERALAPDMTYERAGAVLRAAYDPPFFATYFYGLDVVGHTFMRFARPEEFGNVTPEQARRYGRIWDHYAAHLSQKLGERLDALQPGEILLLVSTYGMEPVPLWRRLLSGALVGSSMTGTHARAPDGVIFAFGDGIRSGVTLESASILDVAPTVLYLMGLPVARDMEGRVLTEIVEESFARAHPVTFIPSYQSLAVSPVAEPFDLDLPPIPDDEGS